MKNASERPIIRRKKVIKAEGHHGGAWKIAYADFVTAMMAFFLLMWLLNATSDEVRTGLADYFNPRITLKNESAGGEGNFQGDSLLDEEVQPHSREGTPADVNAEQNDPERGPGSGDTTEINDLAESVEAGFAEGDLTNDLTQHLAVRVSDEGVVISLFDTEEESLFGNGSSQASEKMLALLSVVAKVLGKIENPISITGHTSAVPFSTPNYSNWDLSIDRAQSIRQILASQKFDTARLERVTGKSDREPATDDPIAAENRRIDITLLVESEKAP
ncbi:flagellar motor protein MotB [Paracoccaceae bacterium GXU_MW_L88]